MIAAREMEAVATHARREIAVVYEALANLEKERLNKISTILSSPPPPPPAPIKRAPPRESTKANPASNRLPSVAKAKPDPPKETPQQRRRSSSAQGARSARVEPPHLNGRIETRDDEGAVCARCGSDIFAADVLPFVQINCDNCCYHRQCFAEWLITEKGDATSKKCHCIRNQPLFTSHGPR
jgi:hypothetical protein